MRRDTAGLDALLVEVFLEAHKGDAPIEVVLDVDATDDPLHGEQEGRFFHGYYKSYCYLPLYIFCGHHLLCARLRTADQDAAQGVVEELEGIVGRIRSRWPGVGIVVRGDSGFCRDELMKWCEEQEVEYVLGLAKNPRLTKMIAEEMAEAKRLHEASGEAERVFAELRYRTRDTWSCERRVVAKAEHMSGGENPRFIVTSYAVEQWAGRELYEQGYCARRGDGEPYQGAAVESVCRPHVVAPDAGESDAAVLCLIRLRADAWVAANGAGGHGACARAVRDDSREDAQDWGADSGERSQGVVVDVGELSAGGVVPGGAGTT